jgi:rare lipoprotein A
MIKFKFVSALIILAALSGCASAPRQTSSVPPFIKPPSPVIQAETETKPVPSTRKEGGYYLDDGPGDNPPANLDKIPDAVPRLEKLHPYANQPYMAFGARYVPTKDARGYKARGVASWYGRRYHGKPTASGEAYDMYQMTAAHPTLPIPSYVRVTNTRNNKTVTVRINDRGPFRHERVIDLSYAAAYKLGYVEQGSTPVEVEIVTPISTSESSELPAGQSAPKAKYYLQLGAFTARGSADSFFRKLKTELKSPGEPLQVSFSDGLYRVRSGPYASLTAAKETANRIERTTQLMPVIVSN